ncbi:hypothetical protein PPYR_04024 [Photinus pyralis]|uniref:Uncharacterized protein n=1 Tax=Photinus pyralis TaxID=7054 RepID=A0A5N4AX53_PHOPY|nr:uncharacterized protein LOC116164749 [Photinus pyralis]KAB0801838.1 hypothetical protein PPYR_04024 [Photinus pyralis]
MKASIGLFVFLCVQVFSTEVPEFVKDQDLIDCFHKLKFDKSVWKMFDEHYIIKNPDEDGIKLLDCALHVHGRNFFDEDEKLIKTHALKRIKEKIEEKGKESKDDVFEAIHEACKHTHGDTVVLKSVNFHNCITEEIMKL